MLAGRLLHVANVTLSDLLLGWLTYRLPELLADDCLAMLLD